jgi:hypothetical protein
MHFEILVEDQSGKKAMEVLVPKILGDAHTYRIHPYKGLGKIPKNLNRETDPSKRILLNNLPRLLLGYGQTYQNIDYPICIVVVCDLDKRCHKEFRKELLRILKSCNPRPHAHFCFAIEEGEAWFLGDLPAIKRAYPRMKSRLLENYKNDSVCDTWELLADAIFPGGRRGLSARGWGGIGEVKSLWAENISPHMDVEKNLSPSFCYFRDTLREHQK